MAQAVQRELLVWEEAKPITDEPAPLGASMATSMVAEVQAAQCRLLRGAAAEASRLAGLLAAAPACVLEKKGTD